MSQDFVLSMRATLDTAGVQKGAREASRSIVELNQAANESQRTVQSQINQRLGIGAGGRDMQQARADVAAYGQELDQLRARYNPLFAATQQYEQSVRQIQQAQRVGAISSREMSDAIGREQAAYQRRVQEVQRAEQQNRRLVGANSNLSASFRNTASSIAILDGPLGGIASRFSVLATLTDRVTVGGAAVAVGLGALAFTAQRGVAAFSNYERQQLTTQQVIRATGMAAGRTAEQIEALSQEIGLNTLASTSEVRDAAAQLLTFRAVSEENFDRALRSAQDLAAVGFGSISSAAVQLGKALEDPATGLSALTRVGVSFSPVQQQIIEDMVETGRTAEALRLILDGIERQVGGAGVAAGGGLAGAWDGLTERFGRHLEVLGEQVAEFIRLEQILQRINNLLDASYPTSDRQTEIRGLIHQFQSERRTHEELLRSNPNNAIMHQGFIDATDNKIVELRRELLELETRYSRTDAAASRNADMAREQAALDRIEAVVLGLDREYDALQRSELANKQVEAIRKAGVEAGSQEARAIEELVARNYEYEQAKLAAAKGGNEAAKASEAHAKAIREYLVGQGDELAKLRLEATLVGTNAQEREKLVALLEAEHDIRRLGLSMGSAEAQRIKENTLLITEQTQEVERLNQIYDLGQSQFRSILGDMHRGLQEGKKFWEAFGEAGANALDRIISKALDAAADGIWDMIFNAFNPGGSGGGGGGNWFSNALGWLFPSANGNVFASGQPQPFRNGGAFTNSVVTTPTVFPLGIMGEEGEEAIMPLARNNRGQLGVHVSGGAGATEINLYTSIDARGNNMSLSDQRGIIDTFETSLRRQVPKIMKDAVRRAAFP